MSPNVPGYDHAIAARQLTPSPPFVVAVVLNWNLPSQTLTCIRHLLLSDYPRLSIVVVDNGSTDDSVAVIHAMFPTIDLIALAENRGYAGGNNAGIAWALERGADYVLLVNNDAVLATDAVTKLLLGAGNSAEIATPRIDHASTNQLWHAGARLGRFNPLPRAVNENELGNGTSINVDFAVGCVLLVRRDVFEVVGLLDERYFVYYEDLDFSTRVRAAGFRIVAVPASRAWHEVGASTRDDSPHRTYLLMRYGAVWGSGQPWSIAGIAWRLSLVAHLIRAGLASLRARDGRIALGALRGLRDGLFSADSRIPRIPRVNLVQKSGES